MTTLRRSRQLGCIAGFALALVSQGCADDVKTTVLNDLPSPDGQFRAVLEVVDPGLSRDLTNVVVYKEPRRDGAFFMSPRAIVLQTTDGYKMQIRWAGPRRLVLTCRECGIKPESIVESVDSWRGIEMVREGFP